MSSMEDMSGEEGDQRLVRHGKDMSEEEGDQRLVRHGRDIS